MDHPRVIGEEPEICGECEYEFDHSQRRNSAPLCRLPGPAGTADAAMDSYEPDLSQYHGGVGVLSIDGNVAGHLAAQVSKIMFPSRSPWLWFIVVWPDGRKERSFDDYGPAWVTARELDAGYLEYYTPSTIRKSRIFKIRYEQTGIRQRYDFEWLGPAAAATKWEELGLSTEDF